TGKQPAPSIRLGFPLKGACTADFVSLRYIPHKQFRACDWMYKKITSFWGRIGMEAGLPFVCRQTARPERKPTIGRLPFGPVALLVGVLGVGVSSLHPAHAQPGAQEEASVPRHQSSPQANALERSADAPRAVDRIFDDPLGGVVVNRT